ncbi:MAG TPA: SDR family NAD(P)-dependent oxidoreductase [Chthonomonadales bacterium]|nr:SDR family NAD(P)-dependent oxidoreductase [Chthonomonadales bacterium]
MLNGKVALVTGSTTGIGQAIAVKLASLGAGLMFHGLDELELQGAAESAAAAGYRIAAWCADLRQPGACVELVQRTVERLGRLDILVNNAAISTRADLGATDSRLFDDLIAVNLRAPLLLCREAVPYMRSSGGGAILNIGSVNGYCGERNLLAYSISKGGLMTLSRNLADALSADGIRVNHFNLGWVLTPNEYRLKLAEGLPPDWPERIPPGIAPGGRLFRPEEIAHFAASFVTDEARLVSGAVVDLEQYPIIGRNPPKSIL